MEYDNQIQDFAFNAASGAVSDAIATGTTLLKILCEGTAGEDLSTGEREPSMPKGLIARGGLYFETPVRYAVSNGRGAISEYGEMDLGFSREIQTAKQAYKQYYSKVSISDMEEGAVQSPEAKLNLLVTKYKLGLANIIEAIGADLYNTDAMGGAAGLSGLGQMSGRYPVGGVGAVDGDVRTWMGITSDAVVNPWWGTSCDATQHLIANVVDPAKAGDYIQDLFRKLITGATHGNIRPNWLVTTRTIYNYLLQSMITFQHFVIPRKGDLGFEEITIDSIPVVVDDSCPEYHIYALNTKPMGGIPSLALSARSGFWMKRRGMLKIPNQLVSVDAITCQIALVGANPRFLSAATRVGDA